jgi:hypothetical protein
MSQIPLVVMKIRKGAELLISDVDAMAISETTLFICELPRAVKRKFEVAMSQSEDLLKNFIALDYNILLQLSLTKFTPQQNSKSKSV